MHGSPARPPPRTQDPGSAAAQLESAIPAVRAEEARLAAIGDAGGAVVTNRTGVGAEAHKVIEVWSTAADFVRAQGLAGLLLQRGGDPREVAVASVVAERVVPALLELTASNPGDDGDWSVHKAASVCLTLWAKVGGRAICDRMLDCAESLLPSPRWQERNAALHTLGGVAQATTASSATRRGDEHGEENDVSVDQVRLAGLTGAVVVFGTTDDAVDEVRDSAMWFLCKIAVFCPEIALSVEVTARLAEIFVGKSDDPDIRIAHKAGYGMMSLVEAASDHADPDAESNEVSPFLAKFCESVYLIMMRPDAGERVDRGTLRRWASESLTTMLEKAPLDCVDVVAEVRLTMSRACAACMPNSGKTAVCESSCVCVCVCVCVRVQGA
jgi:hypothetical protein